MAEAREPRTARLRRIVTGHNSEGRSVVIGDGPPDPVLEFSPGDGLYEAWSDEPDSDEGEDAGGIVDLLPARGGAKLRWFTVMPLPPGIDLADIAPGYAQAFATMTSRDVRPDISRHPGMHRTETLDFIVVIEGRVRLLLDDDERELGPGDMVVQRATNHAWVCAGDTPALLAAILIDKTG